MEQEKIKCIYYIKDNRTDKIIYIGQTKDFKQRRNMHFYSKDNQPVDKYMFEEGRENFSMNIFEDIKADDYTNEELRKKEDELIIQYDTINNGMNKIRSGLISKDKKEYKKEYRKTEKSKEWDKQYYKSVRYREISHRYEEKRKNSIKRKIQLREAARRKYAKKKLEKLANETS